MGKRPHVRGVAMNPVDHPHGGGEGKTSGGRHPVTPWGVPTKGYFRLLMMSLSLVFLTLVLYPLVGTPQGVTG